MEKTTLLKDYRIFAVIVCYNEKQYVVQCLESLLTATIPITVVVVDNHSTDGTSELLRQFGDRIVYLFQHRNLGYGIANNVGIQYALGAGADYVLLLNMDLYLERDCVEHLLHAAIRHPEYSILAPMVWNFEKNKLEKMFFQTLSAKNELWEEDFRSWFSLLCSTDRQPEEVYRIGAWIPAATWFVPAQVFREVGGFSPLFFPIYCEDEELWHRMRRKGYYSGVVTSAIGYHDTETRGAPSWPVELLICNQIYVKALDPDRSWLADYFQVQVLTFFRIVKNLLLFRKEALAYNVNIFKRLWCSSRECLRERRCTARGEGIGIICHLITDRNARSDN